MATRTFTNVLINHQHYKIEGNAATGSELKQIADIPVVNLLFREAPGPGDDELIADSSTVQLHHGDRFYDMPQGNFG